MDEYEAIAELRSSEAWTVFDTEMLGNILKREYETLRKPVTSAADVYAAERAKGAIEALERLRHAIAIGQRPTSGDSDGRRERHIDLGDGPGFGDIGS